MDNYQMPWRPNYEAVATLMWMGTSAVALMAARWSTLPPDPYHWIGAAGAGMALWRGAQGSVLWRRKRRLTGRKLKFIKRKALYRQMKPGHLWVGYGFEWTQEHAQATYEILKRDTSKILPKSSVTMGSPWIHGLSKTEKSLQVDLGHTEGHLLVVGTTGSGKTRLFDLLVSQAIARGECVVIVDPKGDADLRENARAACIAAGNPDRFVWFHPAFPEESTCINPLQNFTRLTEIASRIAALVPSETGADPFAAFAQLCLNNIVQGLSYQGKPPTLVRIRSLLEGGIDSLVERSVSVFADHHMPAHWQQDLEPYLANAKKVFSRSKPGEQRARGYMDYYWEKVKPVAGSPDLEGILNMAAHNREHLGKMLASLFPILNMLTSGPLGHLLSPDAGEARNTTNTSTVIEAGQVLYIGLDSLSDAMVGSAIGSMILADLAAVAGARYNYGEDLRPVNVFVDEAAEVLNDPTIQLLNKGRGAKFRLLVATQTISDFIVRTGSQDKALQVLGNINNTICLRVTDNNTQEYIAEGIPKTRLQYIMRTQGSNSSGDVHFGGNSGERLMEEEGDMIPAALLGELPNLEYFAKVSGGKLIKGRLPILLGEGA